MKSVTLVVVLFVAAAVPAVLSAPYAVYETLVPLGFLEEAPEVWEQELESQWCLVSTLLHDEGIREGGVKAVRAGRGREGTVVLTAATVAHPAGFTARPERPTCSQPVQMRVRRGVSVGVQQPSSGGARVSAQGSRTVLQGQDSRVNANAHWARTFGGAGGPPTYGGGLDYQHPRGSAAVDVSRTPGFGTQVGAQGAANLWRSQDGRSSLDANARWSRNYGGPWGTSRPDYYGGINFMHRF